MLLYFLPYFLWQQVRDSGPIYKETVLGRLPVEPFNTASNLIFLLVIIYFLLKVSRSQQPQWFIKGMLPVFFIGWVGGTVYHATRSGELWLLMDWVPIVILSGACSIYFIFKSFVTITKRLLFIILVVALNVAPRILNFSDGYGNSIGYAGTALGVIMPIVIYLKQTLWIRARYFVYSVAAFLVALSFRTLDKKFDMDYLWMGTHWLWHLLGGVAVFWMMLYIYKDNELTTRREKQRKA